MEDLKDLEKRVSRIETTFKVIAIVAVIFGIGAGWGYSLLNNARVQLKSLQNEIAQSSDSIKRQEILSIKAVKKQEEISKANLSNMKISIDQVRVIDCPNVKDGKTEECKCEPGEIALGVKREDILGDKVDAEKIKGIVCAKLRLQVAKVN